MRKLPEFGGRNAEVGKEKMESRIWKLECVKYDDRGRCRLKKYTCGSRD